MAEVRRALAGAASVISGDDGNGVLSASSDQYAMAALRRDVYPISAGTLPLNLDPGGTTVPIPATIYLPAGDWKVTFRADTQQFDLERGEWTLVDYDEEPTKIKKFKD